MPNRDYVYQPLDPAWPNCIAPANPEVYYHELSTIFYFAIPSIIFFSFWRYFWKTTIGDYISDRVIEQRFPAFQQPLPKFMKVEQKLHPEKVLHLNSFFERCDKKKDQRKRVKLNNPNQKSNSNSNNNQRQNNFKSNSINNKNSNHKNGNNNNSLRNRHRSKNNSPTNNREENALANLAFLCNCKSDENRIELKSLMQQLKYSVDEVRQFRYRYKLKKKAQAFKLKFSEETWKCLTMICMTLFGVYVICHEDAFFDASLLFSREIPQLEQDITYLYYKIGIGYHGHRALWQFFEAKRGDFKAMFLHHWVTVGLIVFSWKCGLMVFGAIVMLCHDNTDIWLPMAKIGKWLEWNIVKNVAGVCFIVSWIAFRMFLFSWKVIIPLIVYGRTALDCHFWKYTGFTAALCTLWLLHCYWLFVFIIPAFLGACSKDGLVDTRSDDEDESDIEPVHLKGEENSDDSSSSE